ncbi:MAG: host-nuclease inhibitor Gam family protein [Deltaproteobacteria bacterium]|nr:host-nuclease inhibitor Gam family protein [Deltaproteobacteria bacterium]
MSSKKLACASPAHMEANMWLQDIQDALLIIKNTEEDMAAELVRLKASSDYWQALEKVLKHNKERLEFADLELKKLMAEQQKNFFTLPTPLGSCSVDLPRGTLLYDKEDYVVKPRKVKVLDNLLKYGFEDAIKRTVAVDWDALENKEEWPDAALAIIGTRREIKETYSYDLKDKP